MHFKAVTEGPISLIEGGEVKNVEVQGFFPPEYICSYLLRHPEGRDDLGGLFVMYSVRPKSITNRAMLLPCHMLYSGNDTFDMEAALTENNGTLDCQISIRAVIERNGGDFKCLDDSHVPQVVIYSNMEGGNIGIGEDVEERDGEESGEDDPGIMGRRPTIVQECSATITGGVEFMLENWVSRIMIPLKGVVDGVADGTQSRVLTISSTITVNGELYSESELASYEASTPDK